MSTFTYEAPRWCRRLVAGLTELSWLLQRRAVAPVARRIARQPRWPEGIRDHAGDAVRFRRHDSGIRWWERRGSGSEVRPRAATPSACHRPSYPLAGCSKQQSQPPLNLLARSRYRNACRRCKRNQELPVRKAGKKCSLGRAFFCPKNGVHLTADCLAASGSTIGAHPPKIRYLTEAERNRPLIQAHEGQVLGDGGR